MHIFQHTHGLVHKIDIRQIVWQFFFCIFTHDGNNQISWIKQSWAHWSNLNEKHL
jgi:hypothetical protein